MSTFKRRFIIGIVVIASNQFSGTNAILYYAKQLFNKITNDNLQFSQMLIIALSVFQVLATLLSTQVVDKLGRKIMILRGQIFVALCLICITIFDKLLSQVLGSNVISICIIALIFLHLLAMNLTLGPCCIIYCT